MLKNITNEFGGLTYVEYEKSTLFNNTGNDTVSDIGFNIFVVSNISQNNRLTSDFNFIENTSYNYFGGGGSSGGTYGCSWWAESIVTYNSLG